MAKNSIPMPTGGGGVLPKLLGTLVTVAVVAMVVQHPADSAHWVTEAVGLLTMVVDGFATFFREVLS